MKFVWGVTRRTFCGECILTQSNAERFSCALWSAGAERSGDPAFGSSLVSGRILKTVPPTRHIHQPTFHRKLRRSENAHWNHEPAWSSPSPPSEERAGERR